MLILRLFSSSDSENPVDARVISKEAVTIGRDQVADWAINDPEKRISRIHCSVQFWNGQLLLTDRSSNGVFVKGGTKRIGRDCPVAMDVGQSFHLGSHFIEIARSAEGAVDDRTTIDATGDARDPSPDQPQGDTPQCTYKVPLDGALLDAFCRGANIDVSSLVEEDSTEIMMRAGAIYREVVMGMAKLIAQRAAAREQYSMSSTTIGSTDNNPFKWAPEQNLASDLLKSGDGGFLNGEGALKSCFKDIETHFSILINSADTAARSMLDALDPAKIEAAMDGSFSLKSAAAKCWERYAVLHDVLYHDEGKRKETFEQAFNSQQETAASAADQPA